MKQSGTIYTIKYALIQSAFWINFVTVLGYVSFYLLNAGLSNSQIGFIMGISCILAAIIQPIVAGYADRPSSPSIKKIVMLVLAIVIVISALMLLVHGQNALLTGFLFGCTIVIIQFLLPFINSLGTEVMNQGINLNWGVARGIGSAAYATLSYIMGFIVAAAGAISVPVSILIGYILLFIVVLIYPFRKVKSSAPAEVSDGADFSSGSDSAAGTDVSSDSVAGLNAKSSTNEEAHPSGDSASPLVFLKKYPRFGFLLIGTTLTYVSHVLCNNFLYQIVQSKGGGSPEMGTIMAICAFSELPTLFLFSAFLKKKGSYFWLRVAAFVMALKIILTLLTASIPVLYLVSVTQMFGWALISIAPVYYVNTVIRPEDSIKGQAYMGMTYTLGSVLASFAGGTLLDVGGVNALLIFGSVSAVIGCIFAFLFTDAERTVS